MPIGLSKKKEQVGGGWDRSCRQAVFGDNDSWQLTVRDGVKWKAMGRCKAILRTKPSPEHQIKPEEEDNPYRLEHTLCK